MKLRCPVCHSTNSLEAYAADDAGRELLKVLSGSGDLFRPLVHYLGLFRSPQRDLSYQRALKLTQDVLALPVSPQHLATAMQETVESMRAKQQAGECRALTNHNYLKRVLETVEVVSPAATALDQDQSHAPRGRRAQAIHELGLWAENNWLRQEIGKGLATLIGLGRDGAPAADTILVTAGLWETLLTERGIAIEGIDTKRIRVAFKELINGFDKWPEPRDLFVRLPRRPERHRLEEPPQPDDLKKGQEFFKKMAEGLNE